MNTKELLPRIEGIFPAMSTALTPEEDLDEAGQRRLVDFLIEEGAHGLWALGSAGEMVMLTDEVRLRATRVIMEAAAGRVPVIVGVGEAGTRRTIERIRGLAGLGVDAVSITAPFYFHHSPEDVVQHFKTILAATDVPVMLYHIPIYTQNSVGLDVVRQLAEHEQVIGIKDSGGSFGFTLDLLQHCQGPEFKVFTGAEELLAASLSMGADGAVLGAAGFAPSLARHLFDAVRAGDREQAQALQAKLYALVTVLGEDGQQVADAAFMAGVKSALAAMGVCGPTVAKPFSPVAPARAKLIAQALEAEGLLRRVAQ